MYSARLSLVLLCALVVLIGCAIEGANPTAVKSKHRNRRAAPAASHAHVRVPRAVGEFDDDDVEIVGQNAITGQKTSSLKTVKSPEFDDEEGEDQEVTTSTKTTKTTKTKPLKQTEFVYDEVIEEVEEEEDGVQTAKGTKRKTGGSKTYTQEFVDEVTEDQETTEDRISQMFGHGLVCLDVHDERTKSTPSFQMLVQELTKKYGRKPHIHTTPRPGGGGSSTDQHEEFEYYVYDLVDEEDPITHKIRRVLRRRITTITEYNDYVRRHKKVLRKTKKTPKCTEPGLLGDENDCTKFFECSIEPGTKGGKVFHFVKKDCPTGTIFDDTISTCNHIWAVTPKPPCWDEEDESPDDFKGYRPGSSGDDDEEDDDTTKKPWAPAFPGQGEVVEEIEDKPPCKKTGYFELPNECHRGYQCMASKGSIQFKQYINCDEPEVFLESAEDCVPVSRLPPNHRCKAQSQVKDGGSEEEPDTLVPDHSAPIKRPTTPPVKFDPKPAFVCEKHGKFPHATKCDTYYTCLVVNKQLRSTKHKCTPGTLFDIEHEMCNPQEMIKERPECADHDDKVVWPKKEEGDDGGDDDGGGQTSETTDLQTTEESNKVDFDESEIETYTDENGIIRRRLKRVRRIVYEYEEEDPITHTVRKIRRIIRTRRITRGEQLEELERITKKKVKRIIRRKVEPPSPEDGQQTEDKDDPDTPQTPEDDDDEPEELEKTFSEPPKKKGSKVEDDDQDEDDVPPPVPIEQTHDCADQLKEIDTLKQQRDDALKNEQDKERQIKILKQEKATKEQIISEKDSLINDLKVYKQSTEELVETLKVERDEAQERVEIERTELDKVKETLTQLKIQKEIDDAELIKLRKELASCNNKYNNLKKVMEGTDAALQSCKHEVSTLQQYVDAEEQSNAFVKNRKRRSADASMSNAASTSSSSSSKKSNFQNMLQNEIIDETKGLADKTSQEVAESPDLHLSPSTHHLVSADKPQAKGDKSGDKNLASSSASSPTVFQQQLPLLIFIFLTLLLVSVIILGCSVVRKLNQITTFSLSADEFESNYHCAGEEARKVKPSAAAEHIQKQRQKFTFKNPATDLKEKSNSYFAYVDE